MATFSVTFPDNETALAILEAKSKAMFKALTTVEAEQEAIDAWDRPTAIGMLCGAHCKAIVMQEANNQAQHQAKAAVDAAMAQAQQLASEFDNIEVTPAG